jgi:hypothetical protein
MKRGRSGFEPCCNVQIAVDEAERIIVATGVTQSGSDVGPLTPRVDAVEENTGQSHTLPGGCRLYRSESNLQALESRGIEGDVALGRKKDGTEVRPSDALVATRRRVGKRSTGSGSGSRSHPLPGSNRCWALIASVCAA